MLSRLQWFPQHPKRTTLLVCLIHRAQAKARDALVELFRKRMAAFRKAARTKLERFQLAHQAEIDRVIATFSEVLDVADDHVSEQDVVQRINAIVATAGGPSKLLDDCEAIRAYSSNNHLGLVWEYYHSHRSLFFRMLDALTLSSTSQDQRLMQAMAYLKAHRSTPTCWNISRRWAGIISICWAATSSPRSGNGRSLSCVHCGPRPRSTRTPATTKMKANESSFSDRDSRTRLRKRANMHTSKDPKGRAWSASECGKMPLRA